jgi:hypothetical protein
LIYEKARDVMILPHFMKGLRPELRMGISSCKPRTLAAAVKAAEEHEAYVGQYGGCEIGEISHVEAKDNIVNGVSQRLRKLNDCEFQKKPTSRVAPIRQRDDKCPEGTVCHYCQRPGHYQRDCRTKKRDQERGFDPKTKGLKRLNHPTTNNRNQLSRNAKDSTSLQSRLSDMRLQNHPNPAPKRDEGFRGKQTGNSSWINNAYMQKNGERPPHKPGGLRIPRAFPPHQRQ